MAKVLYKPDNTVHDVSDRYAKFLTENNPAWVEVEEEKPRRRTKKQGTKKAEE